MVIIMTLIVVCALFAILGGLAFIEVNSLRSELQTQRLLNDKAISHIDEYCDRLAFERSEKETYKRLHKAAVDHNQVLSKNLLKSRDRNGEALNRITVLEYQASCKTEVCNRYLEELKVLRTRCSNLDKELQSIKDTLPDWAGGTVIDDEDVD